MKVAKGWGAEGMGSYCSGYRVSPGEDGNVPEMDGSDGCTLMYTYLMLVNGSPRKCYNGKFYIMYISPRFKKKKYQPEPDSRGNGGELCEETVGKPSLYSFHLPAFANDFQNWTKIHLIK